MNKVQMIGIGVSILSGGAALFMVNGMSADPTPVLQIMPKMETDGVLVAKHDLPYGLALSDADTDWVEWPKNATPIGALTRSQASNAKDDVRSAYVHAPFSRGKPMRMERLTKGASAGVMATMLGSGKRAVAVDVTLNNTAGGFILPNDRVDVLRTFRDAEASRDAGRDVYSTEVVLPNMRVLAMGQTI